MDIHPKPLEDPAIIKILLNMVEEILYAGNRDTDQLDSYSVAFINQGISSSYGIDRDALGIDFAKFPNQLERIDFIKSRNKYKGCGLKEAAEGFLVECDGFYKKAKRQHSGADVWTFLEKGLTRYHLKEDKDPFKFAGGLYQNRFRNILILLTDGYIETGYSHKPDNGSRTYGLGYQQLTEFRNAYINSGSNNIREFFKKNHYGIVPLSNKNLENLEVLVLELYDRSLNKSGVATVHPADSDIVQLFWEDWFINSGVKKFEMHRCFPNENIAEQAIRSFILEN